MGIGFTVFGLIFFIVGIVTGVMFRKMQAVISGEPRALFLSFTVIGIAFSAVGIGMLLSVKKAVKKRKALLEGGKYLTAKVIDVIRDNSIEVNGRPAMAFLCEYYDPLTKETTVFRSDAVIKSPDRPFVGEIVRVYVNRDERPASITRPYSKDKHELNYYFLYLVDMRYTLIAMTFITYIDAMEYVEKAAALPSISLARNSRELYNPDFEKYASTAQ